MSEAASCSQKQQQADQSVEPANVVIFGASGDLTQRKLLPALARMLRCGLLHPQSRIIGVVRDRKDEWVQQVRDALQQYSPDPKPAEEELEQLMKMITHVGGDLEEPETYLRLKESLQTINGRTNALFYCAIPPRWYGTVVQQLAEQGLQSEDEGYRRIVIEKPFGRDYETARKLNKTLWQAFDESQIYRIDHYLGKESVQNLFVFRFANSILEPLWNRNYIDHVQISAAETLGVEYRAPYYEQAGALRDMIQSHLMQVMTLVAMEPPAEFSANALRDEKVKVLRAIRPIKPEEIDRVTLGAQYAKGKIDGEKVPAYCTEPGVAADSSTETFAAVRFYIDNWRWQRVPFILWSGKRMKKKVSEVVIRFRRPPHNLFESGACPPDSNSLIFRLQPDEGMLLQMNAKLPGLTTDIQHIAMDAPYQGDSGEMYEAYEILLHDVLSGEASLFSRADEVEESWKIVEPILDAWEDRFSIDRYRAGTWDIPEMEALTKGCVDGWHLPHD